MISDAARRTVDVCIAVALLGVTAPISLLVAVAIRVSSPGPALYKGTRLGRDGHEFAMYKFRTMRLGSDRVGLGITGAADKRITPLGRILRISKLDELPQLINVVRGEMSLVGPRPEAPEYVALYDARQRQVLLVRPGITGPTQLMYRHEERLLDGDNVEGQYRNEVMPRKLEMDLEYLRHRSLHGDILTLFRTFRGVLTRHEDGLPEEPGNSPPATSRRT